MAFFELRQYQIKPGKLAVWVRTMEEKIIPFQTANGMVICGSFRGETDESIYVWIRRFDSEEQRAAQYEAVYETDFWKNEIRPIVQDCINRETIAVTRIVATPRSLMQ